MGDKLNKRLTEVITLRCVVCKQPTKYARLTLVGRTPEEGRDMPFGDMYEIECNIGLVTIMVDTTEPICEGCASRFAALSIVKWRVDLDREPLKSTHSYDELERQWSGKDG